MKHLDSYPDLDTRHDARERARRPIARPATILEACGGQASNLLRFGLRDDLLARARIRHGPSCAISALPASWWNAVLALADTPRTVLCAPGDLLRVPIGPRSLQACRDLGADVRVVYSPWDALAMARKCPDRRVVALAVGFEPIIPVAAAAVLEADRLGLGNFSLHAGFLRSAVGIRALLESQARGVDAVLLSGPSCAVTGLGEYQRLAARHGVPMIATGPEPLDLLEAMHRALVLIDEGRAEVENQYARAVRPDGNPLALQSIQTVFETADAEWTGFGWLADAGLALRPRFRALAAVPGPEAVEPVLSYSNDCRSGEVNQGLLIPTHCPSFGCRCRPDQPRGAPMASAEGVCSAYYRNQGAKPKATALATRPTTLA